MGKSKYLESAFWESNQACVFWNPKVHERDDSLEQFVSREVGAYLLFATSGTTGKAKWVCLTREALLSSARAVNSHLGVEKGDRWFLAIPDFHVGGMGVYARAYLSNGEVTEMSGSWNADTFVVQLEQSQAQWVSLVPTQVVDLVSAGLSAPACLKGVIVGGGGLHPSITEKVIELGWPILQSYGMSEAASQIATAKQVGAPMEVIPHIRVQLDENGILEWQGDSMMVGYLRGREFEPASSWVKTNDKVAINAGELRFLNRADRIVKILGELIDVGELEAKLNARADQEVVLKVEQDTRRGALLIPVIEQPASEPLTQLISSYTGLEKLAPIIQKTFPRNALGKVMKREL